MKIKTEKRCGCRDESGKQLGKHCPKLRRAGHGKWSYRFRVPDELVALVGKQYLRGSGYSTADEAEGAAQEEMGAIRAGQQHVGSLTTGTYLDQWLKGKRRLRPTARRSYEGHIRLHLKPWLGGVPLTGLRAHHISKAYQRIEETNRAKARPTGPGTIALVHATLRNALNDAVDQRMIPFNPAAGVELPEYTRPEVEPWEAHEVGAFLDEAATDRLAAMWELIALHGLRRGEACGATWEGLVVDSATVDDPDGPAGLLTITQQITENSGQHGVWPPKTRNGKRKVDVDATTLGALLAHRVAQEQEREQVGEGWDNGTLPDQAGRPVKLSGLMFTRLEGLYLPPEWVSTRMQQIARRAGLVGTVRMPAAVNDRAVVIGVRSREPLGVWTVYRDREPLVQVEVTGAERIQGNRTRLALAEPLPVAVEPGDEIGQALLSRRRLHDLRHSSASIQLAEGIDLAIVSKRLGHSSPAITGSIYAHLLRPAGQRAARTVAAAIPRKRPDVPTTCPRGSSDIPS